PEGHTGNGRWIRQERSSRRFGWHAIAPEDLAKIAPARGVKISYERGNGDYWERIEKTFEKADVDMFSQPAVGGTTYRNLMIWRRQQKVSLMARAEKLNIVDREHVPDLSSFLTSLPDDDRELHPISDLAEGIGAIDPATVLDSILSRQWGQPKHKRREFGKSDFCVHASSFGPVFEDRLFPEREQQDRFWPQDSDFKSAYDDIRTGLALQIHRGVWKAIHEAVLKPDGVFTVSNATSAKTKKVKTGAQSEAKLETKRQHFINLAEEILPDWFGLDTKGSDPATWDKHRWDKVADAMQRLIASSDHLVERDPTIRRLIALRSKIIKHSRNVGGSLIDPDRNPEAVSLVLKSRLDDLAGPTDHQHESDIVPQQESATA
ncbi:MAG: hypothetical protein ACR2QF_04960, partial [Geminicoccaceae bacterium]